jgi:hypothetical protein
MHSSTSDGSILGSNYRGIVPTSADFEVLTAEFIIYQNVQKLGSKLFGMTFRTTFNLSLRDCKDKDDKDKDKSGWARD